MIYLVITISYSLILLLNYDFLIYYFPNDNYHNLFDLTLFWCIFSVMLSFRNGKDIICQVLQKFKKLSVINTVSSIVTLAACIFFATYFNLKGNILGLILGEFILILMLYNLLRVYSKNLKNPNDI